MSAGLFTLSLPQITSALPLLTLQRLWLTLIYMISSILHTAILFFNRSATPRDRARSTTDHPHHTNPTMKMLKLCGGMTTLEGKLRLWEGWGAVVSLRSIFESDIILTIDRYLPPMRLLGRLTLRAWIARVAESTGSCSFQDGNGVRGLL